MVVLRAKRTEQAVKDKEDLFVMQLLHGRPTGARGDPARLGAIGLAPPLVVHVNSGLDTSKKDGAGEERRRAAGPQGGKQC